MDLSRTGRVVEHFRDKYAQTGYGGVSSLHSDLALVSFSGISKGSDVLEIRADTDDLIRSFLVGTHLMQCSSSDSRRAAVRELATGRGGEDSSPTSMGGGRDRPSGSPMQLSRSLSNNTRIRGAGTADALPTRGQIENVMFDAVAGDFSLIYKDVTQDLFGDFLSVVPEFLSDEFLFFDCMERVAKTEQHFVYFNARGDTIVCLYPDKVGRRGKVGGNFDFSPSVGFFGRALVVLGFRV